MPWISCLDRISAFLTGCVASAAKQEEVHIEFFQINTGMELRHGEFRWGSVPISEGVSARGLAWYGKVPLVVMSLSTMLGDMVLAVQFA